MVVGSILKMFAIDDHVFVSTNFKLDLHCLGEYLLGFCFGFAMLLFACLESVSRETRSGRIGLL